MKYPQAVSGCYPTKVFNSKVGLQLYVLLSSKSSPSNPSCLCMLSHQGHQPENQAASVWCRPSLRSRKSSCICVPVMPSSRNLRCVCVLSPDLSTCKFSCVCAGFRSNLQSRKSSYVFCFPVLCQWPINCGLRSYVSRLCYIIWLSCLEYMIEEWMDGKRSSVFGIRIQFGF